MEAAFATCNPSTAQGLVFSCTDGPEIPPIVTDLASEDVTAWFTSHPDGRAPAIKILSLYVDDGFIPPIWKEVPFTREVLEHATWTPQDYCDLALSRAGGCAALLDEPWRFTHQTPFDFHGPFCSLVLSRRGVVVKGVYIYDHPDFEPTRILKVEHIMSGWRGSGMQIISLPQAILKAQIMSTTQQLTEVADAVENIELSLVNEYHDRSPQSYSASSRKVQRCGATLVELERRSRFSEHLMVSIEAVTAKAREGTVPWPPLHSIRGPIAAQRYEFETLPRRMDNARNTISSLVQQQNERMNFDTAESTRRIAEATLSESASMRTIAILTMVFLPGTAVASFFSMAMFNWSADSGSDLASRWLWIYFVVAVPLTCAVLGVWMVYSRRMSRRVLRNLVGANTDATPLRDGWQQSPGVVERPEDVEMQTVEPNGKAVG